MKQSFKRHLNRLLSLMLMVGMLVTYGGGISSAIASDEEITITFFHQWAEESRLPYWTDLVERYNAQSDGITVKMEAVSNEPYKDKLRVVLGGKDVPDIFFTWDGDYVARFARNDVILNLDEYLAADSDFHNGFNPGVLTTGAVDGSQYGLPVRTCVNFFLYNTQIFADNNLSIPTDWDEFMDLCATLKDLDITPLALGNLEAWPLVHYISAFNLQRVPEKTFEDDYYLVTGEFTDPGYIEALEIAETMFKNGYWMDGVASTSQAAAREVFNAGASAMIYDQCGSFKTYYHNTMEEGSWDIFPMPPQPDARGNTDMMVAWIDQFVISKSCEHPEAAIDFLKFFYNHENQVKMTEALGFVSTIDAVATDQSHSFKQLNEAMEIIGKTSGFTATIDLEMNASVASVYMANIQELLTGKTPAEIMTAVQNEAARVMKEDAGR